MLSSNSDTFWQVLQAYKEVITSRLGLRHAELLASCALLRDCGVSILAGGILFVIQSLLLIMT